MGAKSESWERAPVDVQLLHWGCLWGRTLLHGVANLDVIWADYVRPFLASVAGARVSPGEERERARACDCGGPEGLPCESRRSVGRHFYCVAETCKCPKTWWWPFSRLVVKRRLRHWACPLGRFRAARSWVHYFRAGVWRTRHRWPQAVREVRRWWRLRQRAPRPHGCRQQRLSIGL